MMSTSQAVISISHDSAEIVQFDASLSTASKVKAHAHSTGQHHSQVRSEHEFFGHVCDAIDPFGRVLVTGPHMAIADFERYARKHRPATAARIVAYEVVDHPTHNQLVAMARKFFERLDQGAAMPAAAVSDRH